MISPGLATAFRLRLMASIAPQVMTISSGAISTPDSAYRSAISRRNSLLPGGKSLTLLHTDSRRAASTVALFSFSLGKCSGLGNADPKGTISGCLIASSTSNTRLATLTSVLTLGGDDIAGSSAGDDGRDRTECADR